MTSQNPARKSGKGITCQKSHKGTQKSGRRMLILLLCLAIAILIFVIAAYPLVFAGAPKTATIRIPRNATENIVRDSLEKYLGGSYTDNVMLAIKMRGADFSKRHGSYEIPKGMNAMRAMRRLTSGAETPVKFTINGFRGLDRLAGEASSKMDFSKEEFLKAATDPETLAPYGLTPECAAALFIDDTYETYWSGTPEKIIEKIGKNYSNVWNDERRKKAASLGMTPQQVMILASIVDEETNAASEKGTIGRLYINRLDKGMRLQADPTVKYAIGDFEKKRITKQDLQFESPYNTYRNGGLPPGPIRTTSKRTIDAILDSKPHRYLYMCAREDFSGRHNFAETYGDHTRNALRYQHALDERGIK